MKRLLFLCLLTASLAASEEKRRALYQSLDPTSVREHLAFYELYKETPEGKKALADAWKLLSRNVPPSKTLELTFPETIDGFIALIEPIGKENPSTFSLSKEVQAVISTLCEDFPNQKKRGRTATSVDNLAALPAEEIDLSRALLLSQFGTQEMAKIQMYESALDLMALQVRAKLSSSATNSEKVQALNQFIFFEMGFRFPPHSAYNGKIDLFTFLPHVLESRRGVCLGVSMLYLTLAERIDLPLEIITPPGHIYVRHQGDTGERNIETTCRGVHIPTDDYLSINTKTLSKRSVKEVIGMAHYNHASSFLAQENFEKALESYEKALPFMPDDHTLKILYGCSLLLCDRDKEAFRVLQEAKQKPDTTCVSANSLIGDILDKKVDKEGLKPCFYYVDHTRASILRKKEALEQACARCPEFRTGLFQLAMCWLQLGHENKAIEVLERYHTLDPNDITVEFYLSQLYFSRFDINRAWRHCLQAQALAKKAGYMPKILKRFSAELTTRSPEPQS